MYAHIKIVLRYNTSRPLCIARLSPLKTKKHQAVPKILYEMLLPDMVSVIVLLLDGHGLPIWIISHKIQNSFQYTMFELHSPKIILSKQENWLTQRKKFINQIIRKSLGTGEKDVK